jgi:anti-sigma factor RsiW
VRGCRAFEPLIHASVEGEILPAEALRVAHHLDRCTACRIVMARESRLAAMLDDLGDPIEVDESFFEEVMASLPERAPRPAGAPRSRARFRRGLKLAGIMALATLGAGLAARVLPSLRIDLSAPAMPRFSPENTEGWVSLFGAAAQWIRVTAQSIAWTGSPDSFGPHALNVLSLEAALLGGAIFLAVSGALMLASRVGSRAS